MITRDSAKAKLGEIYDKIYLPLIPHETSSTPKQHTDALLYEM